MKCISCGRDSKKKERTSGTCPGCGKRFAFEPTAGDPFTDAAFAHALDAISAGGKLRFGPENLWYELARRKRPWIARDHPGCFVAAGVVALFAIVCVVAGQKAGVALFGLLAVVGWGAIGHSLLFPARGIALPREKFDPLWRRWIDANGLPPGLILHPKRAPRPPAEPDLPDYSFDRAVITDRPETVDLLLFNNFHFENNCAVLSYGGYPDGPFETVRQMLRRNPRLEVYVLHDATPFGCRLARRLAADPAWFHGTGAKIVDVGLHPGQAGPFRGLLLASTSGPVHPGDGISESDAIWLSSWQLEVAAIRPDQVLKRLFRAMKTPVDEGGASTSGGLSVDASSFGSEASDSDGGADSFG